MGPLFVPFAANKNPNGWLDFSLFLANVRRFGEQRPHNGGP